MSAAEFYLPTLPPSKNALRNNRAWTGTKIPHTKEYKDWRINAGKEIMIQRSRPIKGDYNLLISAARAEKTRGGRKRDLGNILEATEDLLQWMRVIENDHMSEQITLRWIDEIDAGVVIRVEAATS